MIGNLSTEIDAKEQYMVAIAPILPEGVTRIKRYIQDMVQIDQRNGELICLVVCVAWWGGEGEG